MHHALCCRNHSCEREMRMAARHWPRHGDEWGGPAEPSLHVHNGRFIASHVPSMCTWTGLASLWAGGLIHMHWNEGSKDCSQIIFTQINSRNNYMATCTWNIHLPWHTWNSFFFFNSIICLWNSWLFPPWLPPPWRLTCAACFILIVRKPHMNSYF